MRWWLRVQPDWPMRHENLVCLHYVLDVTSNRVAGLLLNAEFPVHPHPLRVPVQESADFKSLPVIHFDAEALIHVRQNHLPLHR